MKLVGGPRSESYWLYAFAGMLLAAGPLWHYLYVNRYPVRPELFLLVGGAAVAGAIVAVLAHRIGGLAETHCFALLLYLFVDLQFDLDKHLRWPVLLALALGLSLLLQRRRATITVITLGAFYLASLPRSASASDTRIAASRIAPVAAGPPVLLHVILDEQWGIGGLQLEGDTATAAFLRDFYQRRGFELYPAAYSRFHRTIESLTELLSLGQPSLEIVRPAQRAQVRPTIPYFELLRSRGYAIRVFQTSYVDFCQAPASPVASCETYSANSVANVGHLDGFVAKRAMLASRYFLNLNSHLYRKVHPDPVVWRRASAGGALRQLRHVREAIATDPPVGVAYFVHVMLPHRPLELDRDCRMSRDLDQRFGDQTMPLGDSAWVAALALAGNQIRCTHRELGGVLDALERSVGRDSAIVLIHGDHGSRIFQNPPKSLSLGRLDDRQLSGRFWTLLAVRRPGAPTGGSPAPVPVQDFVWRLARQNFAGPVQTDFDHFVRVSSLNSVVLDSLRRLPIDRIPWSR